MAMWKLKLTLAGCNDIIKLIIPANCSLNDLHEAACSKFKMLDSEQSNVVLQYMDTDFNEFMNLTDISDVTDLMSVRLSRTMNQMNERNSTGSVDVSGNISGDLRDCAWPQTFEIPPFADVEVNMFLKSAEADFAKDGTVVTVMPRDIKIKILDAIANKVYAYTAYASIKQIEQVAEALTNKYQSLKSQTARCEWQSWYHAISFKMGNFRGKLRKLGSTELHLNGGRRSKINRPDAPPSASGIKKAKKGELNFQPNLPVNETADTLEGYRLWMVTEMAKTDHDLSTINCYMGLTFASRRKEINELALAATIKDRWPALFTSSQLRAEFNRLNNKRLDDLFGELDTRSGPLMQLLAAKKGKYGTIIKSELAAFSGNLNSSAADDITGQRTIILRLLPMLLDEDPACLYRTYEDVVNLSENFPPHIGILGDDNTACMIIVDHPYDL